MAKKNSTKTATKEALQNSEPKLQAFKSWKGINFSESSPLSNTYVNEVFTDDRQTDLAPNFLLMQNNLKTTPQTAIEASWAPMTIIQGPKLCDNTYTWGSNQTQSLYKFTGVNLMDHEYIYLAGKTRRVNTAGQDEEPVYTYHDDAILCTGYEPNISGVKFLRFGTDNPATYSLSNGTVTDMLVYLDTMIVMTDTEYQVNGQTRHRGGIWTSNEAPFTHNFHTLYSGYQLTAQTTSEDKPVITTHGDVVDGNPSDPEFRWSAQVSWFYSLTNRFGATEPSNYDHNQGATFSYFNIGPSQWTNQDYVTISGTITQQNLEAANGQPIGVDIYMIMNEATEPIFVGHADVVENEDEETHVVTAVWSYDFYGAMADLNEWSSASMSVPEDNTTGGVPAEYVAEIDGRFYFWGDPERPYRLYIGGNAGNELSLALGVGGAYIDIEPGSGTEIKLVEKYKTQGGSSIVTILCSNVNGRKQSRYNLIETNITITSDLSIAGYMAEEISNVLGTTSRHGGGAWSDGLYYITRNGLYVTTMVMEYNTQLRSSLVSEPISPVFQEQSGTDISNSYLVCINDVIYMATCANNELSIDINEQVAKDISEYNSFIWCYDTGLKVWYTLQPTIRIGGPMVPDGHGNYTQSRTPQALLACGLFNLDHEESMYYGLGVIDADYGCYAVPLLSNQETFQLTEDNPQPVTFMTAELGTSNPNTQWQWLCQLEFNFDYFFGLAEITVEGVDYYGRRMTIKKRVTPTTTSNGDAMLTALPVHIRVDTLVRYYHITISGIAMFRLTSIVARTYTQSKKMGLVYGFDASHTYPSRFDETDVKAMHHAVKTYNNLSKLAYTYRYDDETGMCILEETSTVT